MKRFSVKLLWGIGIFLFCLAAILGAVHFFGSDKTIEFRDIDTDYVYYDEDGGFFHYSHSFLINNCPADTTETYEAISEYAHSHFDYDSYASLMEELQQDRNVKELYIFARFFKVSSTLPWDWQPKYADGILTNDDDIDKHLNDCVGSLSISPVNDRGDLEIVISVYSGTAQEFSAKEIWKSNRPVTQTDPAEISQPEEDSAQTTENPKEALENLFNDDRILFRAVDDFDNDGSYEAFAFKGKTFSSGIGCYGSILYAANEEITVVNDDAVYDDIFVFEVGDGTKYLCLRVNDAWNPSLIYGVKDGLPEQTVLSDIGPWFTVLSENEFTLCHSTLDGISLGGGHTGKPYYFYYDNGFREYGATEISVEEFREYDPSSDYLSYIEEKDGEIRSILRRSNHLIHVNYRCAISDALQPVWQNYYLTFREQDGTLTLVEENIGIYLAAMVPEIAVYEDGGEPVPVVEETGLAEWLKENLWDILGSINVANLPEVRDYVNPRSAKLYLADIDGDGNFELIHSLFTGTYTTIDSVYKLSGEELVFYGYYYSGLYTEDSGFTDGVYTNGSEKRTFCSRYVTSGGADQPYWIRIYEMKFDSGIKLVPIISGEWAPSSHGGEYRLVKAEYDGGVIYDENEYHQWLADFLGDFTAAGDFLNIIDSMDVPFSVVAKEFITDEKEQEIIDWICGGLIKSGEPAGGESNIHALRKDKCTRALVDSFQSGIVNEQKGSLEQKIIYSLMDRDVICYYAFRYASSAIEEEARYRDDIFEIKKHALFRDYSELKNFVHDTYTEENAEKLLKERDPARALYFSEDQRFLYHAENLGIVNFDIFSEGYEIEITNADDDEIEFICYYSVWQDEEMKPIEKAALCRAKIEGSQWKLDRNGWLC